MGRRRRIARAGWLIAAVAAVVSTGCGGVDRATDRRAGPSVAAVQAGTVRAAWTGRTRVRGIVDLTAPRRSGVIVIEARGRLGRLSPAGRLTRFAPSYAAPPGLEPYIVLSPGIDDPAARCGYPAGAVFALRLANGDGVTEIDARGRVRKFAVLPRRGLENGITFDTGGRFDHRLLVTQVARGTTTLYAIDCRGRVQVLTRHGPRVEGGIAVAPRSFGRFGGDVIGPDEISGRIWAIGPAGRATLVAVSGLPHGQDIGVESEGFVPAAYREALVADRGTPGNRHPGDNLILRLSRARLQAAGVRAGDLLAVSEGGAATVDVRCNRSCTVRQIAAGPPEAHIEGHVVFTR